MRQQLEKMAYKFLTDVLALLLLVFFFDLLCEAIVPGYISSHLSFTKLTIFVVLVILGIAYLGKRNEIEYEFGTNKVLKKNKIIFFLVIMGLLFILSSLFGLGWFEILVTVVTTIIIAYLFFQLFFLPDKN
jgi:hypothetical protein